MKPLLVFAMEQESQDVFRDCDVLHTGIGKVNAAFALTRRIYNAGRPGLVVNLGTAGSAKHPGGSIVNCTKFVQRDMDVTALGFEKYQTPFSSDPVVVAYGRRVESLPEGVCGSGDSFDTDGSGKIYDVSDMEAYALALICEREAVSFLCLKYISDGADGDAHVDWNEALHRTAEALRKALSAALII